MRRSLHLVVAVALLPALFGCNVDIGRIRRAGTSSATGATAKDCAACEKMCAVAGDVEKKAAAVDQCKADCKKSCR